MPAIRENGSHFTPCEDDPGGVICQICTWHLEKTVIVRKTGKLAHNARQKHLKAVEAQLERERSLVGGVLPDGSLQSASDEIEPSTLLLAERYLDPVIEVQDKVPLDNPFRSVTMHNGRYLDDHGEEFMFSAGEIPINPTDTVLIHDLENLEYLKYTTRFGGVRVSGNSADEEETEESTMTALEKTMRDLGLHDDEESDSDDTPGSRKSISTVSPEEESQWAPHGSKTMFMLDLLDNLPRLRLSDDHLKTIIWVMRECGTPNVPAFSALRKLQSRLTKDINVQPKQHTSSLGNHFYMNHPLDLLALDWANPLVRDHIQIYPEVSDIVSESWQADKWLKEIDYDDLSPMWADWAFSKHRHFFIKEVAQLKSGELIVPMRWIIFKKAEHVDCYRVRLCRETGKYSLFGHGTENVLHRLPVTELKHNFLELSHGGDTFEFCEPDRQLAGALYLGIEAHPLRKIADNRPLFVLRIMPWCDDVSGNRSKQYNAHVNIYSSNAALPHRKLSQEYFVRFCSTSTHASALEQFDALSADFGKWKSAYDCKLEGGILFQIFPHALPADNPQQAESCSCGGLGCSHNCRYDEMGGSKEFKETDEGYHAMFEPGIPRTPEKTVEAIKEQIMMACLGVQEHLDVLHRATGIKDKIAVHWMEKLVAMAREKQDVRIKNPATRDPRLESLKGTELQDLKQQIRSEIQQELLSWVIMQPPERYDQYPEDSDARGQLRPGDHFNVLLRVRGLDPHKDSPCEILHTYLLGQDKYIWHETSKKWDKKKEELFAIYLGSSSLDGLSISSLRPRYCVQYKNSLIGKHFKALQQLAVFHLNEILCPPNIFDLWKASGELGALLWIPEIKDMTEYLSDLDICIANVLDLWAVHDPNRIIVKFKLHVLPHLIDDIRRLGPAILFSTEVFECWNAIFRLCSVLSNHLSPSHDIASTVADMERFKHQVSGGWWKDLDEDWIQAGPSVRNFLKRTPELQRRLGWANMDSLVPGAVKLQSNKKREPQPWKECLGEHWNIDCDTRREFSETWVRCKYAVAASRDICKEGSWVFARNGNATVVAGRVAIILSPTTSGQILQHPAVVVVLRIFEVGGQNDLRMNMPILTDTGKARFIHPKDIMFLFNAQHDCRSGKCKIVEKPVMQERERTTRTEGVVQHLDDTRFFINMHGLHNAHLLRETLPRHLTKPKPIFPDRRGKHKEMAAILRVTGPAKRAETKAKTANTRNQKKQREAIDHQAREAANVEQQEGEVRAPLPGDGEGQSARVPVTQENAMEVDIDIR